ncbi:MAG: hypothetical protein ABJO86_14335 [Lentilitoribacter sp.]
MKHWPFKHTYRMIRLDGKDPINQELLDIINNSHLAKIPDTTHFSNIIYDQFPVSTHLEDLLDNGEYKEIEAAGIIIFDNGKTGRDIRSEFGPEILHLCLRDLSTYEETNFAFIEENFRNAKNCSELDQCLILGRLKTDNPTSYADTFCLNDFPIIALYIIQKMQGKSNSNLE